MYRIYLFLLEFVHQITLSSAGMSAISFSLPFNNSLVTISNAKGQKIIHLEESLSDNYEIPLNKFSTGVHFLNIKHDNRSETIKFIVAK